MDNYDNSVIFMIRFQISIAINFVMKQCIPQIMILFFSVFLDLKNNYQHFYESP